MAEGHGISGERLDTASGKDGSSRRGVAASVGAMFAAFAASLCCIGPVLFVTLGVGAGLASRFEPLRPYFTIVTIALIAIGFYTVYGRRTATAGASCEPDGARAVPRNRRREKVLLWMATFVALLLLTFPQWSKLLVQ